MTATPTQRPALPLYATETNAKAGDTPFLLHPPSSPREGGFFPRGRPADFPQRAVGLPSMPKAPGAGSTAQGLLTEGPAPGRSAAGPVAQDGASCAEVLRASVPHKIVWLLES